MLVSLVIINLDFLEINQLIKIILSIFIFLFLFMIYPFLLLTKSSKKVCYFNFIILLIQFITSIILIVLTYKIYMYETGEGLQYLALTMFIIFILADLFRVVKYNISKSLAKYVILFILVVFLVLRIYQPYNSSEVNNLKEPVSITIALINSNTNIKINKEIIFDNKEALKKLFSEFDNKKYNHIRNLGLLHYSYLLSEENQYFLIIPEYDTKEKQTLSNGYIDSIRITVDNKVFIQEKKQSYFLELPYRIYSVDISQSTIESMKNLFNKKES